MYKQMPWKEYRGLGAGMEKVRGGGGRTGGGRGMSKYRKRGNSTGRWQREGGVFRSKGKEGR